MTKYVIILLTLVIASCSGAEVADTAALHGHWRIVEEHGPPLPAECRNATYVIDANTITMRSGTLAVSARYRVVEKHGNWRIEQSSFSHNGGKNCQGYSADYVVSHYVKNIDLDFVADRLRIYDLNRDFDSYADFVRTAGAAGSPVDD